ncbi:unnamed protein product [Ilex paraguariensis]|uniref:Uncharacterized protein n=1 Tax=Ilex paraguariensis TaxID=185542 RepID=A0ABC8R5R2_9AQUA
MGIRGLIFTLLVLANSLAHCSGDTPPASFSTPLNRSSFPADFVFGAASAAYQKDIQLLKGLGGKISGGVNQEGIKFYNDLINELKSNGLKPFVTLFHWDVPQPLQDEYGGFLHANIVNDYRDYVDICFKEFGDRVKHWITLNEPLSVSMFGYATGTHAPGRCSNYVGNCTQGNSAIEPYVVAHHQLLAHAAAVRFLHPITYGDYPPSMRSNVGNRLPKFSMEQSKMLSIDFLGINYYTCNYASPMLSVNRVNLSYTTDNHLDLTRMADQNNSSLPIKKAIKDELRIKYYQGHFKYLQQAIKKGANVKGHFVWSFLDDFEWDAGFTVRFGLTYIDYKDNLKRYLKLSAFWFKKFLQKSTQ